MKLAEIHKICPAFSRDRSGRKGPDGKPIPCRYMNSDGETCGHKGLTFFFCEVKLEAARRAGEVVPQQRPRESEEIPIPQVKRPERPEPEPDPKPMPEIDPFDKGFDNFNSMGQPDEQPDTPAPQAKPEPGLELGIFADVTWSVSRVKTFLDCPRKFWLHYIGKVPYSDRLKAFAIGSAFHKGREMLDNGEATLEDLMSYEFVDSQGDPLKDDEMVAVRAGLLSYVEFPPPLDDQIIESEVKVHTNVPLVLEGHRTDILVPMIGYIDAVTPTEVVEFKFAAERTEYSPANMAWQAAVYTHAYRSEDGTLRKFRPVVYTKPGMRQGVGEPVELLQKRILEKVRKSWTGKRAKLPYRIPEVPVSEEMIQAVLDEIGSTIAGIVVFFEHVNGVYQCPAGSTGMGCMSCGYRSLCAAMGSDGIRESISVWRNARESLEKNEN